MKINPVRESYTARLVIANPVNHSSPLNNRGVSLISFRSGNPKHIAHIISEEPLFGFNGGGVGTVSNDYNMLDKDAEKIVKILPLYNQEVIWKEDFDPKTNEIVGIKSDGVTLRRIPENLPEGHPFKGSEGAVFVTSKEINKTTDLVEFLKDNAKDVFPLEEIKSSNMEWGLESKTPIAMYRAKKTDALIKEMEKRYGKETADKLEYIFTYVDSTASMAKQYDGGGYATVTGDEALKRLSLGWKGMNYGKFDKATVELLPALKEKYGIDPGYILCSDSQTMPSIHFAAVKNAAGDTYYTDKFFGAVGHNMNDGYIEAMGARDVIVNLASKEELEKILNSKEYFNAVREGQEEAFLKSLIPQSLKDGRGCYNASMFPIYYAEKEYVPMFTTVSDFYRESITNNELVSPALYSRLKDLEAKGRFKGIVNVLMDPSVSGFTTDGLQEGYKTDSKIKLKDGSEVVVNKFLAFDKDKAYDLNHIRSVKKQNLLNLLDRYSSKYEGSQLWNGEKWLEEGSGFSQIVGGKVGRKGTIHGKISQEYIDKIAKGEDIKTFVFWGRGDFQKGADTALETFEKFVEKTNNKDSILLMGGDMKNLKEVVKKVDNTKLKGRVLLLDGWTPGLSFASVGDYALLPSRFAPCELSDLEAMKFGCTPIVPKVQGMDQKVIDVLDEKRPQYANGYKGKHEYFMTEETAYKAANDDAKSAFDKAIKKIKEKLNKGDALTYKKKIGKDMPQSLFDKKVKETKEYRDALKELRDSIISDDLVECIERAMNDRNSENSQKILKNHVDLKTTWEANHWLTVDGKSSGQLYREYHFQNKSGRNISSKDVLKLDISKLTPLNSKGRKTGYNITNGLNKYFHSRNGKLAAIGIGAAALGGLIYAGRSSGWLTADFEDKKKSGELSVIG